MKSDPPTVFLSYYSQDRNIADQLKQLIKRVFGNSLDVFEFWGGSARGANWRDTILKNLKKSSVALILLTPEGSKRDWVVFEAGASWIYYETVYESRVNATPPTAALIPCLFNLDVYPDILSEYNGVNLQSKEELQQLIVSLINISEHQPDLNTIEGGIEDFIRNTKNWIITKSYKITTPAQKPEVKLTPEVEKELTELVGRFFMNSRLLGREMIEVLVRNQFISEETRSRFLRDS